MSYRITTTAMKAVWEPPIFGYSNLIGEAFEKKKEAVLKLLQMAKWTGTSNEAESNLPS